MLVVTGGAGFIGSALIRRLNELGFQDILVVDNFSKKSSQWRNLLGCQFYRFIHKDHFFPYLDSDQCPKISAFFHMGACSSTTEDDMNYLYSNNVDYSIDAWNFCLKQDIPFIYASSAATYGAGEKGYRDDTKTSLTLTPINPYGFSKFLFDRWVLHQTVMPKFWAGLKFFNVYGPGETHKNRQASVVYHAFHQIQAAGHLKLFKSYREDIRHGEQRRDFVYVKDVTRFIIYLWTHAEDLPSRLWNVGTGQSRTFLDLATAVFSAMNRVPSIEWIDMPEGLAQQYQYYTQADMDRVVSVLEKKFYWMSLEDGVSDYIAHHLARGDS